MKFLCLHGMGTNSQIFESQTAAIRHELGDSHTYEWIEGSVPCAPAPGLDALTSSTDEFFRYIDEAAFTVSQQALSDLEQHVIDAGPFDGLFAFSEGAALAASLLVRKQRQSPSHATLQPIVKCAILFSGGVPHDPDTGRLMSFEEDGECIDLPTAHVWGTHDTLYPTFGPVVSAMCKKDKREIFLHSGGHEIPGPRDMDAVKGIVGIIRKTVERATIFC